MPDKKIKGFRRGSTKKSTTKKSAVGPSGKRKLWTSEQMEQAMSCVGKGQMSANKAADFHGVPRSTLKDRLSVRVVHGTNPGQSLISRTLKKWSCQRTSFASAIGLGKTRRDVKCIVASYTKNKGTLKGGTVSNGWWEKFLRRNPMLSLRSGDSTAGVRMDALTAENMKSYFDLLRDVYNEFDFQNHPESVYNMDETGVPLESRSQSCC